MVTASKIKRGYRLTNIIFEDTRQARPYQDGNYDDAQANLGME